MEPATWVGNAGVQAILSDGLEKVYEVITASSYDVRYNLLTKNNHPRHLYNFLHRALGAVIMQTVDLIESPTLSVDDRITYIQPAFFEDPDPGPVDIWEWAHQQEPRMRFVYKVNRASLREWGYVIWDRVQLDALQILGSPWQTPADHFREEVPEMAGERWIESWNERMKIYQNKGRGWWDFGDESKIVWPPGCGPNAPKTRAPKSGSLAAAKAAIHSLTRRISRR